MHLNHVSSGDTQTVSNVENRYVDSKTLILSDFDIENIDVILLLKEKYGEKSC